MKLITTCTSISSWATGNYKAPAGYNFKDPLQGCINDCHLIAALSAVAWVDQSRATLADPPTKINNTNVSVQKTYPYNSSSKPVYASSTYFWPLIYQKACAKYLGAASVDGDPDHVNIPSKLDTGGNPVTMIQYVTSWTKPETFTTSTLTVDQILAKIERDASGKTLSPMGATTENPGDLPSGIYANHAYALLGVATSGASKYIVLRNPYGYIAGVAVEPTANVLTAGIWNTINLATITDNIFALEVSKFKLYFANFGIVKP